MDNCDNIDLEMADENKLEYTEMYNTFQGGIHHSRHSHYAFSIRISRSEYLDPNISIRISRSEYLDLMVYFDRCF